MTAASPATGSRLLSPSPRPALLGATDARRVCDEVALLAPMKMRTCLEIAELERRSCCWEIRGQKHEYTRFERLAETVRRSGVGGNRE